MPRGYRNDGKKLGFPKGGVAWNKGIPHKESTKRRMSLHSPRQKTRLGSHMSEEEKKHLSLINKQNQAHKRFPNTAGENNPAWKGGVSKRDGYGAWKNNRRRVRKMNAEGSHTIGEWELLKKQYGFKCPCCSRLEPEIKLTQDHIIPLVKGGSDFIENIQPLCRSCNSKKLTKTFKYEPEQGI